MQIRLTAAIVMCPAWTILCNKACLSPHSGFSSDSTFHQWGICRSGPRNKTTRAWRSRACCNTSMLAWAGSYLMAWARFVFINRFRVSNHNNVDRLKKKHHQQNYNYFSCKVGQLFFYKCQIVNTQRRSLAAAANTDVTKFILTMTILLFGIRP